MKLLKEAKEERRREVLKKGGKCMAGR